MILKKTLAALLSEEEDENEDIFDLVDQLVAEYGEEDLAQRLYRDIPQDYPWDLIAELYDILIWSTNDNGTALIKTTQQWLLEGDDIRKIQIALNLGVYPFKERSKMVEVLSKLAIQYPAIASRCQEWINKRR
ncbi:MAG: hypothetical protein ACFBSE_04875 [Prochloraceae cyanobacterium]